MTTVVLCLHMTEMQVNFSCVYVRKMSKLLQFTWSPGEIGS